MSKRTASDRFGQIIGSKYFTVLPQHIFTHCKELGITHTEAWFIGAILQFKWTAGLPYPSLNKLAKTSGISSTTIHKLKKSLVKKGLLKVIPRYRTIDKKQTKSRSSNAYDFEPLFRKIEEFIDPSDW